jgi:hypothetical protein
LSHNKIKVLVDAAVHFECEKVIKYHFKAGSIERSIDLDKEGIPQQEVTFSNSAANEKSKKFIVVYLLYHILTV